jgi:hypothetical protein
MDDLSKYGLREIASKWPSVLASGIETLEPFDFIHDCSLRPLSVQTRERIEDQLSQLA